MASTFHLDQELCTGCGQCVPVFGNLIELNAQGKASFVNHGDTATYGDREASFIFAAIDECHINCIEEIG